MLHETGCDGVMIARGALGNPWIFKTARLLWELEWKPGDLTPITDAFLAPSRGERIDMLIRHFNMICEDKGEDIAVREIRKFVGWYTKGMRGAPAVRREINQITDAPSMIKTFSLLKSE